MDFAAAIRPHVGPLAMSHGFSGPTIEVDNGVLLLVRYDSRTTSLLLSWDVRERLFGCHLARRQPDGGLDDDRNWLTPNEILAVRGARDRWVTVDDTTDVDWAAFSRAVDREMANLRDCGADVLDGDFGILRDVRAWHLRAATRS